MLPGQALAYCSKDVDPHQLVQTIKEVVDGKYVIEGRVFHPAGILNIG